MVPRVNGVHHRMVLGSGLAAFVAVASLVFASPIAAAPAGSPFASVKNCAQLAALGKKAAASLSPTSGGTVNIAAYAKELNAIASAAPSAIRSDFKTLSGAFLAFAQVYAKVDIKAGKVPTAAQLAQLEVAEKSLTSPKLRTAEAHLEAWSKANCK
jgi:hypothetical protein